MLAGTACAACHSLSMRHLHLRDGHDEVIGRVVNFQDLTELKRLEQHARRAERLATIGHLAAGIAHEIRNPLASISGSIELLRQSPQGSEDDRALMAIVNREIQRLNVLIGDLLDYTNPRPKQPPCPHGTTPTVAGRFDASKRS